MIPSEFPYLAVRRACTTCMVASWLLGPVAASPAFGQVTSDSAALEADLPSMTGVARVRALAALTEEYRSTNPARALELGSAALAAADTFPDPGSSVRALNEMAWALMELGRYEEAMERALQAQEIAELREFRRGLARSVNNQGVIHRRIGHFGDALDSFRRSMAIYEEIGDQAAVAQALNNLSVVLGFDLGDFDRALELQLQALEIRETLRIPGDLYQSYNTLGVLNDNLGHEAEAIDYLERALAGWRTLDQPPRVAAALSNLAEVYTKEGGLQRALDLQYEALAIREELDSPSGIAGSLENIGTILGRLGRFEEARDRLERSLVMRQDMGERKNMAESLLALAALDRMEGRYAEGEERVERALGIAQDIAAQDVERSAYLELSQLLESRGDPAGALAAVRQWNALDDALNSEARARFVAALETEYEAERSGREIDRLTAEAALAQTASGRRGALLLIGVLLAAVAFLLYRRSVRAHLQERLEREVVARTADLTRANERLQELSLTDSLTGLRNRRYLFQSIESDLAVSQRAYREAREAGGLPDAADVVFYLLDMDDFKSVNDEYGHAAGDQVLVQVARVLEDAGRASDVVVRWGGEEFLVLSRQVDRDGAAVFAQRIRERIRNTEFEVGDGVRIHRTCSVGFATYPLVATRPDWGSWEYVVGLADMAAYMAKRSGRDAWVGFPTGGADLLQTLPTDPEAARGAFEAGALSLSTSLDADGRSVVWSGDA